MIGKMNIRNIFFLFFFFVTQLVSACGLCPYYSFQSPESPSSYLGVFNRYTVKNGYSIIDHSHRFFAPQQSPNSRISHQLPPEIQVDETRKDFNTLVVYELQGMVRVGKMLDVTVFLPYENSTLYYQRILDVSGVNPVRDTTIQYSGWGDLTTRLRFKIPVGEKHYIRPGVGARISTTRTIEDINQQQSFQVDHTLLPGAGIPDLFTSLEYGFATNQFSTRTHLIKGWTTENEVEYDYGNAFLGVMDFTYHFTVRKWSLRPTAGFYWEYADVDREYGDVLPETGGHTTLGALGFGLAYGKLQFNTLYQRPIAEKLKGPQLGVAGRLISGIIYQL